MKPKIVEAVGGYLASFDVALPKELDDVISLMLEERMTDESCRDIAGPRPR